MRFMVSFDGGYMGGCGNQCFDSEELADQYANQNKHRWVSASMLQFNPNQCIAALSFVKQIVEKQYQPVPR